MKVIIALILFVLINTIYSQEALDKIVAVVDNEIILKK